MIVTTRPAPAVAPGAETVVGSGILDAAGPPPPGRSRLRRLRRPSTPLLLRLGMGVAAIPVVFFAAAVQLGVARNDATVETVARDATRGITVAQSIKLNLAELDEIVVQELLDGAALGANGFPVAYDDKRGELHDNLVLAASDSAYRQPLVNIDYALAHYHTLVKDAFAAAAAGDRDEAADVYGRAHLVMEGTLLGEADFVDKANTYVLNNAYDTQKARSASTVRLIVVSWVVLVAFLVVVQVLLARKFRRLLNVALAAASVVAVGSGGFALAQLSSSASDLTTAREQAFDSVHVLARAGATVVSARQSQGHLLLDPGDREALVGFEAQTGRLFRVQGRDDVTSLAQAGAVPEGAGGFLATVATAEAGDTGSGSGSGSGTGDDDVPAATGTARPAIVAFGDFLAADAEMRDLVDSGDTGAAIALHRNGAAFSELIDAIGRAQATDQATFDRHAAAAVDATAHVDRIAALAGVAILGLVLLGLYQRLREYAT